MKEVDKKLIKEHIFEFERLQESLSPEDAERFLVKILTPLMAEEGYEVTHTGGIGDKGIDFLAIKDETKIGIQYKHFSKAQQKISIGRLYELVGSAIINKLDKIIFLVNTGFANDVLNVANSIEPVAVELMTIDSLKNWTAKVEADYEESSVIFILRTFTQKIIELISRRPNTLEEIEWRDLERVIAEVFEGIGFKVELTPSSKDGGKDVILECTEMGTAKSYVIEIKHWRSGQRVGEKKIREFVKVITKEKHGGGLFLSTYGFAENAVESLTEIEKQKVKFGQKAKIVTLCKTYMKRKSGLWNDEKELPTILFEETD